MIGGRIRRNGSLLLRVLQYGSAVQQGNDQGWKNTPKLKSLSHGAFIPELADKEPVIRSNIENR